MRVKLKNEAAASVSQSGPEALRPGRAYTVQEISTMAERASYFRIEVVRHEPPALFDVRLFEVVTPLIPSNWAASLTAEGLLTIGPLAWRVPEFWNAVLDRQDWAVEAYEKERDREL